MMDPGSQVKIMWHRLSDSSQRWIAVFAAWTLFGTASYAASLEMSGGRLHGVDFLFEMLFWYTLAAGTPAVFWLAQRFPIERGRVFSRVLFHFGMALLYLLVYAGIRTGWDLLNPAHILGTDPSAPVWANYVVTLRRSIRVVHFDYWALLGIGHALNYYRSLRERERESADLQIRTSQLEAQLAGAQLEALRMQLNPHFLFNTLHSIAALVRENNRQDAVRMIAGLGDLLRQTLDIETTQEVTLKQEIEFLEKYLDIEQIRFQDRLRVCIDVHPDAFPARVPYLILQPLVENAIRHGISQSTAASLLELRARRQGDRLYLKVRDDGPGIGRESTFAASGIGLRNVRARLLAMYGSDHAFSLQNGEAGGAVASIVIPFRPAEDLPELKYRREHGPQDTSRDYR